MAKKDNKTLEFDVLRGKDKIGENLIEITYGNTKILVELGKALDGDDELSELENSVLGNSYSAVIVSHYHQDHAGLIRYKNDCPVYIGCGAYRVVAAMNEFHGKKLASNVATYRNGKAFYIGEVRITPFLCDHSAFDSYMLLFQANGKSILYTGDFRFHGRKDKEKLLAALPKLVDVLIHEGTNIGSTKPCFSESQLEDKLVEIMKHNDKPVFVLQSASNIDRLVSVYRAAKRSGRILYEDNYTALIAVAAAGKIPRPDEFPDVYAFTPRLLRSRRKDMFFEIENKRGLNGIVNGTQRFVMLVRPTMLDYIKKLLAAADVKEATLVYSMWQGYKNEKYMSEFLAEIQKLGIKVVDIHTSGHASAEDVELLKQTVNPKQTVCVHTEFHG